MQMRFQLISTVIILYYFLILTPNNGFSLSLLVAVVSMFQQSGFPPLVKYICQKIQVTLAIYPNRLSGELKQD